MPLENATPKAFSPPTPPFLHRLLGRLVRRNKAPPPEAPLGLSWDQVDSLLALRSHPGWKHYQQALEALAVSQGQSLVSGVREYEEYLFQAGALSAIRRIHAFPELLDHQRKAHHDRTQHRADAAQQHDGSHAFLNTLWYELDRTGTVRDGGAGMGAG